ncbi:hypothetical protein AB0C54_36020, partial [Streptomyces sp. NPDC048611]
MSRRIYLPLVLVLVVVAGAGLALFQPWKAFSDTTVNESLPSASAPMKDGPQGKGVGAPSAPPSAVGRTHPRTTPARLLPSADPFTG